MRALVPLALWLGLWAPAAYAQSFLRTAVPGRPFCVVWNGREYLYRVDSAGSARTPGDSEQVAIEAAFDTWRATSRTCSDFTFTRGPDIERPRVGFDRENRDNNENVLTFRETACSEVVPPEDPCLADDTCGNKYACWDHGFATIALATITFSFRTGYILDADIEFNAAAPGGPGLLFTAVDSPPCEAEQAPSCVSMDLQNTLTHEIGHVVGLDHVFDMAATMAPSATPGETRKRVLDAGSAAGFCSAYPRGLPPTQCGEPATVGREVLAESVGSGCGAAPGPLLPALIAAALLAWRRRRGA